jgi:ABC-type multidrug transport system ATPase subunit
MEQRFIQYQQNMSAYCLEVTQLSHRFREKEPVLDNISLHVPEGAVYGFLGPNGAGKTTTLKLMTGLLKKQQGSISVFGKPLEKNRISILRRTGVLIETPSVYSHLTAPENLDVLRKVYGAPKTCMQEVLRLVNLENTAQKKAGRFSLGMKQRLAIAIALLNSPSLLILDEPTNGLDPNGIIEIRELLKRLNSEQGVTIIISSHLLPEIEKLATHAAVINKGRIIFEGSLSALSNRKKQASSIVIDTSDSAAALQLLRDHAVNGRLENGKVLIPPIQKERLALINQQLVQAGISVYELHALSDDLEAVFMNLINNG